MSAALVRAYAAKAEEFAEATPSDLEAGRNIAATSLAIHAGINSGDAVCGTRLGKRTAERTTTRCSGPALAGGEIGRQEPHTCPLAPSLIPRRPGEIELVS